MEKCPKCGAPEVDWNGPATHYKCGSSDYDQRPGTFKQSIACAKAEALSEAADRAEQWFYNTIASAELIELEYAWIPMRMKQISTLRAAITQEADK
jgi:hypothetical protein